MEKSVKFSDGFDHQNTPRDYLHQNDAHMVFTLRKQSLDPVAFKQWHKAGPYTVFNICNRFKLVFATPQKLRK